MIEINRQNYKQYHNKENMFFDSVHDDYLQNMSVDYFNKSICLLCEKTFPQNKKYQMIFHDFIFMNCTGVDFWGQDNRFYDMAIEAKEEKFKSYLISCDALEKEPVKYYAAKDYILVWLGFMSGDAMNIICKKITMRSL